MIYQLQKSRRDSEGVWGDWSEPSDADCWLFLDRERAINFVTCCLRGPNVERETARASYRVREFDCDGLAEWDESVTATVIFEDLVDLISGGHPQ